MPRGQRPTNTPVDLVPHETGPVRRWLLVGLLAGAGYLLNLAPIEVFPGIHFVFGGVFALVAGALFGPLAGGLAGFLAALPTWELWNQPAPLSAVLYGLEGAWIGRFARSRRHGVLVTDFVYWILVGSWLNLLMQVLVIDLPLEIGFVIQCRSIINGLLVGMVVEGAILVHRLARGASADTGHRSGRPTFQMLVTLGVTALITLPLLWQTVRSAHSFTRQRVADLEASVERELDAIRGELGALIQNYARGVGIAAEIIDRRGIREPAFLQGLLETVRAEYPEFAGMYVADANAVTLAFSPRRDAAGRSLRGRSYSDRQYYDELLVERDTVVSGVYQARGGMTDPAVAIGSPVRGDDGELESFVLGWFDLNEGLAGIVEGFESEGTTILISDGRGRIVADSRIPRGEYHHVQSLTADEKSWMVGPTGTSLVHRDELIRESPVLAATEGAALAGTIVEPLTGWRVGIHQSLLPIRSDMVRGASRHLLVLIGTVLLALLLGRALGRLLAGPLESLRRSAENLAAGDLSSRPRRVALATAEVDSLFQSFSWMAERLHRSWQRQEELLAEVSLTKRELEATFDSMTDAVVITDPDDRVVRTNRAFDELVGLDAAGSVGKRLAKVGHPDGGWEECPSCRARRSGRSSVVQLDGSDNVSGRPIEVRIDQILDVGGAKLGAVELIRDLTEERMAEERARQNEKLRALGQLAAGVAHNFNNSLASILGYTELARGMSDDSEVDRSLGIVETAAQDAAAMVRRIQQFARTEQEQPRRRVSLQEIVGDALALTRSRWENDAQAAGIRYDIRLGDGPDAAVDVDVSALREVFVNLIINALDAMPDGGELEVVTALGDGVATVTVRDDGSGMQEETLARACEPFFTTKGPAGHGMGLAMAYGTVQSLGGDLRIRSLPGKGTEVAVTLPRAMEDSPADRSRDAIPPDRDSRAAPSMLSVLLVEDEDPIRRLLVKLLEREGGFRVRSVADGDEALRLLEADRFDLVFTDLALPGADGMAIAQRVERLASGTRVVLMSGYGAQALESWRGHGVAGAVDACLSKPFTLEDLRRVIESVGASGRGEPAQDDRERQARPACRRKA